VNLEYCLVSVNHKIHGGVAGKQDEPHGRQMPYGVSDREMANSSGSELTTTAQDPAATRPPGTMPA
jgi:hypothetical protein